MYQAINEYIIAKESSKETASGFIITAKDVTTYDVVETNEETKQLQGKKVEVAHRQHATMLPDKEHFSINYKNIIAIHD